MEEVADALKRWHIVVLARGIAHHQGDVDDGFREQAGNRRRPHVIQGQDATTDRLTNLDPQKLELR